MYILFENKLNNIKNKYSDSILCVVMDDFINFCNEYDRSYKCLEWMIKQYINIGASIYSAGIDIVNIEESVQKFLYFCKFNGLLKSKDINYYDIDGLNDDISNIDDRFLRILKKRLKEGIDYVTLIKNGDMLVTIPLTHKGAAHFGSNTKWCISVPSNPNHFEDYMMNGHYFVIIQDKTHTDYRYCKIVIEFSELRGIFFYDRYDFLFASCTNENIERLAFIGAHDEFELFLNTFNKSTLQNIILKTKAFFENEYDN